MVCLSVYLSVSLCVYGCDCVYVIVQYFGIHCRSISRKVVVSPNIAFAGPLCAGDRVTTWHLKGSNRNTYISEVSEFQSWRLLCRCSDCVQVCSSHYCRSPSNESQRAASIFPMPTHHHDLPFSEEQVFMGVPWVHVAWGLCPPGRGPGGPSWPFRAGQGRARAQKNLDL